MKIARIILILSPLLLLIPPVLPLGTSLAWSMLGMFYGVILRRFPWNLLMGGICYAYASQLGREAFWWGGFSFFFPFITPLILAFVTPKYNSPADLKRRRDAAYNARATGAKGPFQERFPLLGRCFEGKPEMICLQVRSRFEPVDANYEFWLTVKTDDVVRINAEAAGRNLTLWTQDVASGTELFGAGLVQPNDLEAVGQWLREMCVSGEKLSIAWRQLDGQIKFLEFHAA